MLGHYSYDLILEQFTLSEQNNRYLLMATELWEKVLCWLFYNFQTAKHIKLFNSNFFPLHLFTTPSVMPLQSHELRCNVTQCSHPP